MGCAIKWNRWEDSFLDKESESLPDSALSNGANATTAKKIGGIIG